VFLDRDGVVSTLSSYNTGPAAMQLVPGAAAAISRLQHAGCKIVIVSSQSCVGKGFVRTSDVNSVMDRMCRLLRQEALTEEEQGAVVGEGGRRAVKQEDLCDLCDLAQPDAIIFSVGAGDKAIHREYKDTCNAKPSPAGLYKGARCLGLKQGQWTGFMVGDRLSDLEAGVAGGCKVVLVKTGMGAQTSANLCKSGLVISGMLGEADDLLAASDLILASLQQAS
jgi:D-glycero-D-manno-heptose 1,7-bisphosphate phosphatase